MNKITWNCSICTFINSNHQLQCLMCSATNPNANDSVNQQKSNHWECPGCTLYNSVHQNKCIVCYTSNPNLQQQLSSNIVSNTSQSLTCDIKICPYFQNIANVLKHHNIYTILKSPQYLQEFNLLYKILNNILQNPNDNKFKDLHLSVISKKFAKCTVCMDLLFQAGFYKSNTGKRLLHDNTKLDELKNTFNILMGNISTAFGNNYNDTSLLNDFHHLLFAHKSQYEYIHDNMVVICNDKHECKLANCSIMKRNYRVRSLDNEKILRILNINQNNITETVWQRLLDRIHCFYFHSFDIGYKLRKTVEDDLVNGETKCNDDVEDDEITHDRVAGNIHAFISKNAKTYRDVEGLGRITGKNNRFSRIGNVENELIYDQGIRYFYWDYYKDNDEENDAALLTNGALFRSDCMFANDGYSVKDWYIGKKYQNLKIELMQNKICTIGSVEWKQLEQLARGHLKTEYAKKIESWRVNEYGIDHKQPLALYHVIAMMTYCNFDILQAKFSETYRKLTNEGDDELKQRHRNFANFGRLLREFVECYGQRHVDMSFLEHTDMKFWHGVSTKTQFATIRPCIKGPLSTTADYGVAVNYCANAGVIVAFRLSYKWLFSRQVISWGGNIKSAYSDCVWLSDYPNEQERFFIGGYSYFDIDTLKIAPNIDYSGYIDAMRAILHPMTFDKNILFVSARTGEANQISYRLLSHELNKNYPNHKHAHLFKTIPKYIDTLFHRYCTNLKQLVFFAMLVYKKMAKILRSILLHDNGMIKWDVVSTLFPSVEDIWVEANLYGEIPANNGKNLEMIREYYFWVSLLCFVNGKIKVKRILIWLGMDEKIEQIVRSIAGEWADAFVAVGWNLYFTKHGSEYYLGIESKQWNKKNIIVKHASRIANTPGGGIWIFVPPNSMNQNHL